MLSLYMLPLQDEISTGLDSSTTFQIVRNFRDFAHLVGGTVLIALLQPAPEVFDLFDDVMLLNEGGPKSHRHALARNTELLSS